MLRVTNLVFAGETLCAPIPCYGQKLCQLNKFASAFMLRPRRKRRPALLYFPKTQKFTLSSCLSHRIARNMLIKHFETLDNIKNFRLTNVVAVGSATEEGRRRVRLDWLCNAARIVFPKALIRYEPELFNACVICFDPKASPTANVFSTARVVYTGFPSITNVKRVHEHLCNVVRECLVEGPR